MNDRWRVICGDALEVMRGLEPVSVDAIVTDPPYGLGFMGKDWDHGVPGEPFWAEALRVAKPGAHLLAFGGTRTYHRLVCAIEDAGWEVRDCLLWLYGQGFPKSLDVSKAMDRAAGERKVPIGSRLMNDIRAGDFGARSGYGMTEVPVYSCAPVTDAAREWSGWGTALKPACEPICLARKPLSGTVAANVLEHGTGALNVDGCRIETGDGDYDHPGNQKLSQMAKSTYAAAEQGALKVTQASPNSLGRWPANVCLDEEAAALLDAQSGHMVSGVFSGRRNKPKTNAVYGKFRLCDENPATYGDTGGASRFFYVAKAAPSERHGGGRNEHPTVKPLALMRWLVRLVAAPGALVLDPFVGSGTTGIAARLEGCSFVGVEIDPAYVELAERRIREATRQGSLLDQEGGAA